MNDQIKHIESFLEIATKYLKTSYESIRLKTIDKVSDVVSSWMLHLIVFILISSGMLFLNFGLSFWVGKILGNTFYGFFVVAAFYFFVGFIVYFFMAKGIKRMIRNYIIKQALS